MLRLNYQSADELTFQLNSVFDGRGSDCQRMYAQEKREAELVAAIAGAPRTAKLLPDNPATTVILKMPLCEPTSTCCWADWGMISRVLSRACLEAGWTG